MDELSRVDANLLVYLDAILTERSLTQAALRIHSSQSSVSGALARLRKQLGDPLLERSGRGFVLTEKGRDLQPLAREAMKAVAAAFSIIPDFDASVSTRNFLISASQYTTSQIAAELATILTTEAPGVTVEFDSMPLEDFTLDSLLRRDVVLAVAGSGVPGARRILFREELVVIASEDHPRLAGGRSLGLEDLQSMRLVLGSAGHELPSPIRSMFASVGLAPNVGMNVSGDEAIPLATRGTEMFAIVPRRLAERSAVALGLTIVDTPMRPFEIVEAARWHPSKSTDPAIRWLVGAIARAAEGVGMESVSDSTLT